MNNISIIELDGMFYAETTNHWAWGKTRETAIDLLYTFYK